MKILSCGAGVQSTALALMSAENAYYKSKRLNCPHQSIPIYDYVIFCDLGFEPPWVSKQAEFIRRSCKSVGIPFVTLTSPLYDDLVRDYGFRRVVSIPWWTLEKDGHKKSKMPRICTIEYKVERISKFVKYDILGYQKGQRIRPEDNKAHEMHISFGFEEQRRCKPNTNPLFVNKFPLVDAGMTRVDAYSYTLDVWGLETRSSSCCLCPFHSNYFYNYLKTNEPDYYEKLLLIDDILENRVHEPEINLDLFISKSRKRLVDLTPEECQDGKFFTYRGKRIWNGF